MNLLKLKNISKSYGKSIQVQALNDLSFDVKEGEMLAVMGKSGSGKSTMLNVLSGIDGIDSGEYVFQDKNIEKLSGDAMTEFRRKNIGFVVQHFALIDDYNIFDNIALILRYEKVSKNEIKQRVEDIAKKLEITEQLKKFPKELSGGQSQRVAIARAIINKPKILLADEPTGALDETTSDTIMKLFRQLNNNGVTIIIVTHDEKVAQLCDRTIIIKDGKVAKGA